MHPDVHRYLDGEITLEGLSPEARAELREWESLTSPLAGRQQIRAPATLAESVMASLPEASVRGAARSAGWRRLQIWLGWLIQPRAIRLRPATLLLAAAAFLLLLFVGPLAHPPATPSPAALQAKAPSQSAGPQQVYVQFIFQGGPHVASVAVAGDFNGWSPVDYPLQDTNRNGVWSAMFPLPVGLHKYMFVVNGKKWVTDPRAERHVDDGFGMQNAIISVGPIPGGRTS